MSVMRRILVATFLLLFIWDTNAQNYDARINKLLAEIDASDLEYNLSQIAEETLATLEFSQVTSTAVLPFRNDRNRRTGLTEYISAEIARKLTWKQTVSVIPADRAANLLRNQIDLSAINWPQDGGLVANLLGVSSVLRGQMVEGTQEFALTIDVYSAETKNILASHRTTLPRTAGLSRLMALVVQEAPKPAPEKSLPKPQLPPPTDKPEYRPEPLPSKPVFKTQTALEVAIRNLADELADHLVKDKQYKIGVLEFLDLRGRISQLGRFMAEDLTTAFFKKGRFAMVERGLLQQVLREQRLTRSGIIDVSQARDIGRLVGADAIITGSISDIGNEIKANARLINVGQGILLAVAGESIAKTQNVAKMYATILWPRSGKALPNPAVVSKTPDQTPAGYIYYENFDNVQEGMLPAGWLGGEKLMVKSDGRQKFATDFEYRSSHKILIDNVTFPENFELGLVFQFGRQANGTHLIAYLGSMKLTIDVYGWYRLSNTKVDKRIDWRNKVVKAILTKEGPLFKLVINGEEVILLREENYKLPQGFSLEITRMGGFKLMEVWVKGM